MTTTKSARRPPARSPLELERAKDLKYTSQSLMFNFEGISWHYERYFGSDMPPNDFGITGDVFCLTDDPIQALLDCNNPGSYKLVLVRKGDFWIKKDEDVSCQNAVPMAKHPLLLSRVVLDPKLAVWKHKGSYTHKPTIRIRCPNTSPRAIGIPSLFDGSEIQTNQRKRKRSSREEIEQEELGHPQTDDIPTLISPSIFPSLKFPENKWLLELLNEWTNLVIIPTKAMGSAILLKLLQKNQSLPPRPHDGSSVKQCPQPQPFGTPTLDICLCDLASARHTDFGAVNFGHATNVDHVTPFHVMASIMKAATVSEDEWRNGQPLLGALTVPGTKHGLQAYDLTPSPFDKDQDYILSSSSGAQASPRWSSSVVPLGAITHPHADYYGCSQFISHFEGRKLWLLWPCTEQNLNIVTKAYLEPNFLLTADIAIDILEGLELYFLDSPRNFYIPAYHIYATLTFTTSCDSRCKLWALAEFNTAKLAMDMHLALAKKSVAQLNGQTLKVVDNFCREAEQEDLKHWDELASRCEDNTLLSDIQSWVQGTRTTLRQIQDRRLSRQPLGSSSWEVTVKREGRRLT